MKWYVYVKWFDENDKEYYSYFTFDNERQADIFIAGFHLLCILKNWHIIEYQKIVENR